MRPEEEYEEENKNERESEAESEAEDEKETRPRRDRTMGRMRLHTPYAPACQGPFLRFPAPILGESASRFCFFCSQNALLSIDFCG